ncbi:MoaD/ThiS family protein [Roseimaritima sediminicola]|uniref:MoaD/ThiS family protein n=1 Tax=Roseimaritima sediminicola TaxID=2662066 RepID=UPI001386A6A4|nr:MoaD/ThiS family protein [Roseimaritima sediminicola]
MQSERTIRLFAGAREAVGSDTARVSLPEAATAEEVLQVLARSHPQLSGLLPSCRLVAAQEYLDPAARVPADAELALIPPVSGG